MVFLQNIFQIFSPTELLTNTKHVTLFTAADWHCSRHGQQCHRLSRSTFRWQLDKIFKWHRVSRGTAV